ncbi:Carbon monoxide dehydrogenase 2 [Methanoculleus chikugoensis]|jgi:carbon-monoxide dehydrogenase catalytic subunit|uniref:Carbon monoxide dehydrogenase n=1 Tax=Methanoculleus chikugoensis TaxID=118126 RepID=A0A1M4MMT7_9EURY|nr:anaerobic carbon-monoxide dehydrogenase catalytic subunit [Methanoculleus chikugoensis]MDD4567463.1 anaerobic carbon-monoxide dehydrogenase catalytic subunit [Methanoculleus chikugoensis]SCL76108.1 Carbon monoxide dehydrogenase 2 [Methanoculleus chikugoensis]
MTMESNRISYHDSVRTVYERLKADGMSNVWDRYEAQGLGTDPDRRCAFCQAGARCDFCSNGPCRADASRNHRGVCGINADGMAMRMMLLRNVMGASNYHFHAQQAVRTLRATAEGKTPFSIAEPEKLRTFAGRLGIDTGGSDAEVALRLCDFVEEDFHRFTHEPSRIVERLAPEERKETWKRLGLFPGGIYGETIVDTASTLTNVDGWFASHAMRAMRLGVAMAYQSQIVLEYIQDILYGIPRPHPMRVDLGVLDPDYVNILPNGHEPFLGFALIDLARTEEWQQKARAAGAKGLRIIANIETGQELIQRREMDDVFYGYTGNWIMQEAVLATGAVDVFAADMNCSLPLDPLYAEKYHFKLIPVSEVVVFEGGTERLDYVPEEAKEQAAALLSMGIENFGGRREKVEPIRGLPMREAVVGFAPESIVDALGGSLDPLLGAIKDGTIRGIVGLVSCTTLRDSGQDVHTVAVAENLIARDVLVLGMGCGVAALQVAGLCSPEAKEKAGPGLKGLCTALGVPPVLGFGTCTDTGRCADLLLAVSEALGGVPLPDLPVAVAAPEYMEQKATIDALFALALGVYTYVNPVPTVTGGPDLVKLLTEDLPGITGGVLHVETDAKAATDGILAHIEGKREKLGL